MLDDTTSSSLDGLKECVLKTISRILIHGIIVCQSTTSEQESEDERLSTVMNVVQPIQSSGGGEYSRIDYGGYVTSGLRSLRISWTRD